MAVCSEIHTKHINTAVGQKAEFVNVKLVGTYSDHFITVVFWYVFLLGPSHLTTQIRKCMPIMQPAALVFLYGTP